MHSMINKIHRGLAFQVRDGSAYTLRRVTPADVGPLEVFLRHLSDHTRQMRYLAARPYSHAFAHTEATRMVAGSTGGAVTLVATHRRDASQVVAVAELACDYARLTGEVALVVMDAAQRKGIGGVLLHVLLEIAQEFNLASLQGSAFAANEPLRHLIRALQLPFTTSIHSGEMHIIARVPQLPVSPLMVVPKSMAIGEKARMGLEGNVLCHYVHSPASTADSAC